MTQVASDLRTNLDWVAADHYDTVHPHTHIAIRGVDDRGYDLVIAREYIHHGFRARAGELVALDLGPELEHERNMVQNRNLEVHQERATSVDRDLLAARDAQGRVWPDHPDRWEQAARAGRLRILETMGLAHADGQGAWYLQPDLAERLNEMAWRSRMTLERGDEPDVWNDPTESATAAIARTAETQIDLVHRASVFDDDPAPHLRHLSHHLRGAPDLPRSSRGTRDRSNARSLGELVQNGWTAFEKAHHGPLVDVGTGGVDGERS
jgi:hypothetical protein